MSDVLQVLPRSPPRGSNCNLYAENLVRRVREERLARAGCGRDHLETVLRSPPLTAGGSDLKHYALRRPRISRKPLETSS